MEFEEVVEKLLDQQYSGSIFLYSEEGEKLELQKIATIPLDGKIYAILHPVDDDIPENAAFVFRLDLDEQMLTIEEDGDTADAVFDEYFRTMEAEEK